jgi:hypothetical protein
MKYMIRATSQQDLIGQSGFDNLNMARDWQPGSEDYVCFITCPDGEADAFRNFLNDHESVIEFSAQ